MKIFCFILTIIYSVQAIRVPVDKEEIENTKEFAVESDEPTESNSTYYASNESKVDSYLLPPDPHKPFEIIPGDTEGVPVTYLLPPSPDKIPDFYASSSSETGSQSDWYPIIQADTFLLPPSPKPEPKPIFVNNDEVANTFKNEKKKRTGKKYQSKLSELLKPSRQLEPPFYTEEVFSIKPSTELELPLEEVNRPFKLYAPVDQIKKNYKPTPVIQKHTPILLKLKPVETLPLYLTPPKPTITQYKTPTKLYPKKFIKHGFQPVPIPIQEYSTESISEEPRKDEFQKNYQSIPNNNTKDRSSDEQSERFGQKYNMKHSKEDLKAEYVSGADDDEDSKATEQEASESHYRYPGRNAYASSLRKAPPAAPSKGDTRAPPAPGERTEFRMHGMKGPHSYQFGYDTGKGKNRQFRYEERDNDGHVRGHYGYVDKHGKLRVVNYDAHPELGFCAEAPVEKE